MLSFHLLLMAAMAVCYNGIGTTCCAADASPAADTTAADTEEATFAQPHNSNIDIVDASEIAQLKFLCGTVHDYWSQSCGAIASGTSRHCSEGGKLVYDGACATHFARGSKACGVLNLGCRSRCRISALPCRNGLLALADHSGGLIASTDLVAVVATTTTTTTTPTATPAATPAKTSLNSYEMTVAVVRTQGSDGAAGATVYFQSPGLTLAPSNVSYEEGQSGVVLARTLVPRHVLDNGAILHVTAVLTQPYGASLKPYAMAAQLTLRAPEFARCPLIVLPETVIEAEVSASDGPGRLLTHGLARLKLERRLPEGFIATTADGMAITAEDMPTSSSSSGSSSSSSQSSNKQLLPLVATRYRAVYVGGTARPHFDFVVPPEGIVFAWGPGETGTRMAPLTIRANPAIQDILHAEFILQRVGGEKFRSSSSGGSYDSTTTTPTTITQSQSFEPECHAEPLRITVKIPPMACTKYPCDISQWAANVTSTSAKIEALKWAQEIPDRVVRTRFVNAWRPVFVAPGEMVSVQRQATNLIFSVGDGKFQLAGHRAGQRARTAERGELIDFLSAMRGMPSLLEVRARSPGLLWAIDTATLRLHSHNEVKFNITRAMRQSYLRSIILGRTKKWPIFLLPGLMSSRMVAWQHRECVGYDIDPMDQIWISVEKIMQMKITDSTCWVNCLRLDKDQIDPSDCKVRSMTGLNGVAQLHDSLAGTTGIFRELIISLAKRWGYDTTTLAAFPYDWRLSPDMLDRRDDFFSSMKSSIEQAVRRNDGMPAVLIAHSLGNNVGESFFTWLGKAYPDTHEEWIHNHVLGFQAIGWPMLGAVEGMRSLVNGVGGLPIGLEASRYLSTSFGSSHWITPRQDKGISTAQGFSVRTLNRLRWPPPPPLKQQDTDNPIAVAAKNTCQCPCADEDVDGGTCAADEGGSEASWDGRCPLGCHIRLADSSWQDEAVIKVNFDPKAAAAGESAKNNTTRTYGSMDMRGVLSDLVRHANDTLAGDALRIFETHYDALPDQELNPLRAPPRRFPVRHVGFFYGVDVPTYARLHFEYDGPGTADFSRGARWQMPDFAKEVDGGQLKWHANGSIAGRTGLRHGGDGTVNYNSLSFAHAWHVTDDEGVKVTEQHETVREYYKNMVGQWGERNVLSVMNSVDPALRRAVSRNNSHSTHVYEVKGVDHRNVVRNEFIINLIHEHLLECFRTQLERSLES